MDFLLDRLDAAGVTREELLAKELQGDEFAVLEVASLVDFGGVALAE